MKYDADDDDVEAEISGTASEKESDGNEAISQQKLTVVQLNLTQSDLNLSSLFSGDAR